MDHLVTIRTFLVHLYSLCKTQSYPPISMACWRNRRAGLIPTPTWDQSTWQRVYKDNGDYDMLKSRSEIIWQAMGCVRQPALENCEGVCEADGEACFCEMHSA